jgi:hypothetical protein
MFIGALPSIVRHENASGDDLRFGMRVAVPGLSSRDSYTCIGVAGFTFDDTITVVSST